MHWYFMKRISSNEFAIQELLRYKKDILKDDMGTETYKKKAKEIFKRFDSDQFEKLEIEKLVESKLVTGLEPVAEIVCQQIITTRTMLPIIQMLNLVQLKLAPHPTK